jgi:phospholipid/cholesterol/gamma-HCH transport system substrate-binding protein
MSRELKVGLFIVITSIIILAALLYIARGKGVFETVHTFTLSSKSGEGFTEGMPVVFSGFDIGKVHDLELNEKGVVIIKIKIPNRHIKWIKIDSSFILYRPLIGAARIVVITNNLNSPLLPVDKIMEVGTINDINDAIKKVEPLIEQITQIATNIERLTNNLSDPKGDLNRILSNAQKITTNLSTKKSLLEMAVADEESLKSLHESLRKVKDIVASVDKILKKVDSMADKTDEQIYGQQGTLPQINNILRDIVGKLLKLNTTVDNINKISKDTSEGMKDFRMLRSDIDDTVNSIEDVVKKLDSLIFSKKDPEFKLP